MSEFVCTRCGKPGPQLSKAPFRNELGEKLLASICKVCWDQWLQYQTMLINHHGLDVRDKPARDFLTANLEAYLFGSGKAEEIDTSQEGKISW
ncbi:MAG: oxidative damage protection protein [Gemmatimonadota bacterium]|jgi:Fe-S cluster biosynthesis and repair protein YggX